MNNKYQGLRQIFVTHATEIEIDAYEYIIELNRQLK